MIRNLWRKIVERWKREAQPYPLQEERRMMRAMDETSVAHCRFCSTTTGLHRYEGKMVCAVHCQKIIESEKKGDYRSTR